MDVAAWLQDLGLERYVSFRDTAIDAEVLPKLTAEELISIGVTSVGHRRKLLDAIASLGFWCTGTDQNLRISLHFIAADLHSRPTQPTYLAVNEADESKFSNFSGKLP